MNLKAEFHEPVLVDKVLEFLRPRPDGVYLDSTLGGGGHSEAILRASAPSGILWGIDADPDAIVYSQSRLSRFSDRAKFFQIDFSEIDLVPDFSGVSFDGILIDCGLSSHQIDSVERGFSYRSDSSLDMRISRAGQLTAERILHEFSFEELVKIFREYGQERRSRRIARAIVKSRERTRITTSGRLADIVRGAIPRNFEHKSVARIFQALRIRVNDELTVLQKGLEKLFLRLNPLGRLVVISYHSLEDSIVKSFFRLQELSCICPPALPECACEKEQTGRIVTRRIVTPLALEITRNPRARSAKLRAIEKTN